MKKFILIFNALIFFSIAVFGQSTSLTIGTKTGNVGDTVLVPINANNFLNVGAISLRISYNNSNLAFIGVANSSVPFTANGVGGFVNLGWYDGTASNPLNISSGKLLDMKFVVTSSSNLNFSTADCEISNASGDPILGIVYNNGLVALNSASLTLGSVLAAPGTIVSVPVKVSNFTSIGAISLKINHNSALVFTGVSNNNGLTFASGDNNGVVSVGWFDGTGTNPITLTNGATLVNLNFTYNGGNGPLSFNTSECEITSGSGSPLIGVTYNNGGVNPLPGTSPTLSLPNVLAVAGSSVVLPLTAQVFNNVGSFSIKLNYNAAAATFNGLSGNYNGITINNNAAAGVITLGWYDYNGISISNGVLTNLNFTYNGGTSAVNFRLSDCEISDATGNIISGIAYENGSINLLNAPIAPTLVAPADGLLNQPVSLSLSWNSVATATSYRVQVATDNLFSNLIVNDATVTGTSKAISGLNNSTQYYWRVSASNAAGTGIYSEVRSFTTIIATPATPVLTTPANGATGQATSLTLNWNAVTGAATYRVQVATDAAFTNLIVNDSSLTTNSKAISGLLNNTQYYWRVNAKNIGGTSAYATTFNFTTIVATPGTPTLVSPVNGAINQATSLNLSWNAVTGAATYRVQVSTDANFATLVLDDATVTGTTKTVSGLLNATQYFWRVNATNAGGTSSYSITNSFTTVPAVPAVPVLLTPATNAVNQPLSLNLIWQAVSGSVSYRVQLATDAAFTNLIVNDSTVLTNSRAVSGLLNNTQYYWRVNSKNTGGTSSFSTTFSFTTIVAAPGAPTLLSPATGATNQATSLTLSWGAVTGAATYGVQLATDAAFTNVVVSDPSVTGTTKSVTGLLNNTQYYWRVNATNAGGTSAYSTVFNFTTVVAIAGVPVLQSPVNNAVNQSTSLTLTWGAVSGAVSYRVQVATDAAFTTLIVNDSAVTTNTKAVSGLLNNTQYYWRVNSKNTGGTSGYSTAFSFTTIVAAPGVPTLVSPATGASNQATSLTLSWGAVTGAATYSVQLATDAAFTNVVISDPSVTGTSKSVTGLLNNTQYFWRVSATNAGGTSAYSTVFNFTTVVPAPGIPTLQTPVNNATDQPVNLTLTWGVVSGAVSYRVQVATDAAFTTLIVNDSTVTTNSKAVSGLLNNTSYYWRINSKNNGGTSGYSAEFKFTTIVAAPVAPALLSPLDNAINQGFQVTLTWGAVSNAKYRVQVSTDANFATLLVNDSTLTNTQKTVSGLEGYTKYYWRVLAFNIGGNSPYSSTRSFTTKLSDVQLISPSNGSQTIATVTLVWSTIKGANKYNLQLSHDSLFVNLLVNDTSLVDTTKLVSGLSLNQKVFWRVRAKNANGTGNYSGVYYFTPIITGVEDNLTTPTVYNLYQNYPNPFNPSTVINYDLPTNGNVTLKVYDLLGSEVAVLVNDYQSAGRYSIRFNASGLASGVYIYRINSKEYTSTKKLILIR